MTLSLSSSQPAPADAAGAPAEPAGAPAGAAGAPAEAAGAPADRSAQRAGALPFISIVIPVYNGSQIIGHLLDSIQRLDYPVDRYQVLVVDNNSSDDLERVVAGYPVELLHERNVQSSYAARNLGARQARGEIVAFTDADCRVHPQWLRRLQVAFRDPAVGGAAGDLQGVEPARSWVEEVLNRRHHNSFIDRKHSTNGTDAKLKLSFGRPTKWLPRLLKRLNLATYRYDPRLPSYPIAPTANVAYRREVLEKLGYFDGTFIGGGDIEFAVRMQQQTGLKLVAVPDAIVSHRHRASLRQLWKVFARYEIGHLALVEKFLGLNLEVDGRMRRQLVIEGLANLMIGVPRFVARLVFRGVCSGLMGAPHSRYLQSTVVDFVTLMSRNVTRIKACRLYRQGRRGELWMP